MGPKRTHNNATMTTYNHPYSPYNIQIEFMDAITELLRQNHKIGIFESPTGTGKTLSLICSTMTWLRDQKIHGSSTEDNQESDDEPEWVKESYAQLVQRRKDDAGEQYEIHLDSIASNQKNKKVLKTEDQRKKRMKKTHIEIGDDQFIPLDYHSENETNEDITTIQQKNDQLNLEIKNLLNKIENRNKSELPLLDEKTKIIFSSRTHSQLNQFSSQLRLPDFPSSFKTTKEHLKYLPIGSRKQLCIHETVSKISDTSLMNEACLELQKPDSKQKCQYYPSQRSDEMQDLTIEFRDNVFSTIHDIEELPSIGESLGVCPYYSVRKGIPSSEVITLPYQLLLQKSSREALGISIKDSIIIIDEAHNLLDTITSIHSVSVPINHFKQCKESLKIYLSKFSRRLNGGNRIHLMKLSKIITLIIKYLEKFPKILPGKPINLQEIFEGTTGDLLNIYKLEKYLTVSKIAFKIESYIEKSERSSTPTLFKVIDFLKAMSNPSEEGKFFFDVKGTTTYMTYMLLDPSQVFKNIVQDAKCVILAGGTMEPITDFTDYLFPYIDRSLIKKFSCGHVIPKQNLEVFTISGESIPFEFSFGKRNDDEMIKELGKSILKLIQRIPGGIVIFLPSYKYLSQITEIWKNSDLWNSINEIKKVFSESNRIDILSDYSKEISSGNGAVLLSVVGGRLSEGINFSDDLARAVMIIGLPFPNAFSGEIISKRKFIEDQVMKKTGDRRKAQEATRVFYENLCMKAVNQSVGRSIRHINDFSAIYLFDRRYAMERIESKLSQWVKERVSKTRDFNEILTKTSEFFNTNRSS